MTIHKKSGKEVNSKFTKEDLFAMNKKINEDKVMDCRLPEHTIEILDKIETLK